MNSFAVGRSAVCALHKTPAVARILVRSTNSRRLYSEGIHSVVAVNDGFCHSVVIFNDGRIHSVVSPEKASVSRKKANQNAEKASNSLKNVNLCYTFSDARDNSDCVGSHCDGICRRFEPIFYHFGHRKNAQRYRNYVPRRRNNKKWVRKHSRRYRKVIQRHRNNKTRRQNKPRGNQNYAAHHL